MLRFIIKLRVTRQSHASLLAFGQTVASMMNGNLNYVTPNPTLAALNALITDFSNALTAWGAVGNRGSHVQHLDVINTRAALEGGLTTLAKYCEYITPYNGDAFASGGFTV